MSRISAGGADSRSLFEPLKCAKDELFLESMNAYDTIFVDIQAQFVCAAERRENPNKYITQCIVKELQEQYREIVSANDIIATAVSAKRFQQYWTVTGTYGDIDDLISKNFDGLREDIIRMLSGNRVLVNVSNGKNDLQSFKNKSEVITALIHLGYFAYDADTQEAYVPNKEIQEVFYQYMEDNENDNLSRFMKVSERILNAVLEGDVEETARQIQSVHNDFVSGIEYNDEKSLACTIMIALISAFRYYHKPMREFPAGKGFAESLREYAGEILLVGIDYDKKTKEHSCVIETFC